MQNPQWETVDGSAIDPQFEGLSFVIETTGDGGRTCVAIEPEDDDRLKGRSTETITFWMRLALEEGSVGEAPAEGPGLVESSQAPTGIAMMHGFVCALIVGVLLESALRGDLMSTFICAAAFGYGMSRVMLGIRRRREDGDHNDDARMRENARRAAERTLVENARRIASRTAPE